MMTQGHTVEALLKEIDAVAEGSTDFELWVPPQLTLRGVEVSADVAMAVVLDRLLAKGYMPAGFTQQSDGRTYRYQRESSR